jgi:hypothetical protein
VRNQELILELAHEATNPNYVVLSPSGEVLAVKGGLMEATVFVDFLTKALEKIPAGTKVAQAGSAQAATEQTGN